MDEITRQADALMGQERWKEAEALLVYCRENAARGGERALELSLCSELLGFYRMRGLRRGFESIFPRTMELLDGMNVAYSARGTILINAATGLVAFGRAEEAIPLFQEADRCYRRSLRPGDERYAALFNNMASAFESLGAFDRAEEHIRLAMDVWKNHPHHPDMATSYVNLAQLYAQQDPADPRIGECLDAAMEVFNDPETVWNGYYAHTARKCAGGFASLRRTAQAEELEERAALLYEGT